jgi:hypothetical protein
MFDSLENEEEGDFKLSEASARYHRFGDMFAEQGFGEEILGGPMSQENLDKLYFLKHDIDAIYDDYSSGKIKEGEWEAKEEAAFKKHGITRDRYTDWVIRKEKATENRPQFSQYVEPGGTNYREVFVTAPEAKGQTRILSQEETEELNFLEDQANFRDLDEGHQQTLNELHRASESGWHDGHGAYSNTENPIVRLRMNDRTGPNGEKILFLEEIQPPSKENQEKMPDELRKKWREIGMRKAIQMSVDGGYARLAWTTGRMQVYRYPGVATEVESIESQGIVGPLRQVFINLKGNKYIGLGVDKDGMIKESTNQRIKDQPLESVIGKELSKKIVEGEEDASYSGENLKIGGEGLKRIYDQDLGSVVKKFGGKVDPQAVRVTTHVDSEGRRLADAPVPSVSVADFKPPIDKDYEVSVKESHGQPKQSRREIIRSLEVREDVSSARGEVASRRRKRGSLLGLGITPAVNAGDWIDPVGRRIRGVEDSVAVGRLFRNAQFEIFHTLMVRDGKIVRHRAISSRLPKESRLFQEPTTAEGIANLKKEIAETGADEVWFLHNHPSGNVKISDDDRASTTLLIGAIPEAKGHIIIDHTEYSLLDADGYEHEYLELPNEVPDLIHEPLIPHEGLAKELPDIGEIAAWGKKYAQASPDNVTMIYTSISPKRYPAVRAVESVPMEIFMDPKAFKKWILESASEYGSGEIFAYYSDSKLTRQSFVVWKMMRKYTGSGLLLDAVSDRINSGSMYSGETKHPFGLSDNEVRGRTVRLRESDARYGTVEENAFADHPTWQQRYARLRAELDAEQKHTRFSWIPKPGEADVPGEKKSPTLFWRSPANVLSRMGGKYKEVADLITEAARAKKAKKLDGHFYGMQHFDDASNSIISDPFNLGDKRDKSRRIAKNSEEDHMVRDLLDQAFTGLTPEKLRQSVAYTGDKEAAIVAAERMRTEIFEPIIQMIRGDAELINIIGRKGYIRGYFPHFMTQLEKKYGKPQGLAMARALLPERFISKFLQERESDNWASGVSIYDIVPSYIASTMKTIHDIPAYDKARKIVETLEGDRERRYARWYIMNYMGTKANVMGMSEWGPDSLAMKLSRKVAGLYYDNLIGLNPKTWLINLTQPLTNTVPEVGLKYVLRGAKLLYTSKEARQKFHDSGLLLDYPGMESGTVGEGTWRRFMHGGMSAAEYSNRGITYLAGLEQAKDMGLVGKDAEMHAMDLVDKTQFNYGVEGHIELLEKIPPDWRVFQTFKLKQSEFMRNMVADAWNEHKGKSGNTDARAKLARFMVLNAVIPGMLKVAGISLGKYAFDSLGFTLWDLIPGLPRSASVFLDQLSKWMWRLKEGKLEAEDIPGDILDGLYNAFFPGANAINQVGKTTGLTDKKVKPSNLLR